MNIKNQLAQVAFFVNRVVLYVAAVTSGFHTQGLWGGSWTHANRFTQMYAKIHSTKTHSHARMHRRLYKERRGGGMKNNIELAQKLTAV